jgi:ubiquinone/menaquinone biosynthesis C-methylase UbiE
MGELRYDEAAAKKLLAMYVTPDVIEQRRQFLRALNPQKGESVLDVGSGPGFLAAEIAEAIGSTGSVHGIDVSEPMVELARRHCAQLPRVTFTQADATQLPSGDQSFDAAISTQVLEYVPDVDAALAELHRVLRPAGRVVIVDTDWDSIVWHSSNQSRMDRVLAAWEEHAADPHLPRTLTNRLVGAGFDVQLQKVVPILNPGFDQETYSNRLIDLIVSFVSGRSDIGGGEAQSWADELRNTNGDGQYFFSLNRYLFLAVKRT